MSSESETVTQEYDNSREEKKEEAQKTEPLWKWFLAVILLAVISLTTGSPNLYPSQFENIKNALGISNGLATFMLTGGVMIMYITLPAGVFMDHFGTKLSFIISVIITVVSYLILPFTSNISGLFIFFYLLMSFGSSSLFIVNLEIALSRSPMKIKGFSASIVSASLSLSFGLFLEIYKLGKNGLKCRGYECVFSSFQMVAIIIICVIVIASPISYYFFRQFPEPSHQPASSNDSDEKVKETERRIQVISSSSDSNTEENSSSSSSNSEESSSLLPEQSVQKKPKKSKGKRSLMVLSDFRFYLLLIGMFLTVFDGLLVISAGSIIWPLYGRGYPNGASDWGIVFSATNCVCTILLSALLDFILHRLKTNRSRVFGIIWMILSFAPLCVGILFRKTDQETLFGVFMSIMGVPFGFGLSQIPTLVSDNFGNELFGFVFGLTQIGSIAAAASTMPLVQIMSRNDIMITFIVCFCSHLLIGFALVFSHNCKKTKREVDEYNEGVKEEAIL